MNDIPPLANILVGTAIFVVCVLFIAWCFISDTPTDSPDEAVRDKEQPPKP